MFPYTRAPLVVLYDIEGTVVYDPLQALVNVKVLYKGVLDKPMCTHWVEFNDDIS